MRRAVFRHASNVPNTRLLRLVNHYFAIRGLKKTNLKTKSFFFFLGSHLQFELGRRESCGKQSLEICKKSPTSLSPKEKGIVIRASTGLSVTPPFNTKQPNEKRQQTAAALRISHLEAHHDTDRAAVLVEMNLSLHEQRQCHALL